TMPEGTDASGHPVGTRLELGEHTFLFLPQPAFEAHPEPLLGAVREAARSGSGPGGPRRSGRLAVFLDGPVWDRQPRVWSRVAEVLRKRGESVLVVAGGTDRFSCWRDGKIEMVCVSAVGRERASDVAADGLFPGFLWGLLDRDGMRVRVVDATALVVPDTLSRSLQQERMALRSTWTATPLSDAESSTSVVVRNPTGGPLVFQAAWAFEVTGCRAEPEILGFRLDPGQEFAQRFRLQHDARVPLKFCRPRLLLDTVCADGLGREVPVRISVAPHVRMGGRILPLRPPAQVDGLLSEWTDAGLELGHPSQVLTDAGRVGSSPPCSARLHIGEVDNELRLALACRCDDREQTVLAVYLDPRGGEGSAFEGTPGPLVVSVDGLGRVHTEGPGCAALRCVWQSLPQGGVLEAAAPPSAFAGGVMPEVVLIDATLTVRGGDAAGQPAGVLCFSGDGRSRESSALYAAFVRSSDAADASGR
ncbi:MAG: hypothetical protein JXR77_02115, partial [Lentisphaeria bacterium]|nr:hypothetical protein [Lentisphaeria bacterium]